MTQFFVQAFLALALGGLIGLERERHGKTQVGVRTFAALSFFGLLTTLLKNELFVAIGFSTAVVFALLLYYFTTKGKPWAGITTEIMIPFCFVLGVLVGYNLFLEAGLAAIAVTFLLAEKQQVHAFALTVTREEVVDVLLFAVITFIIFPLLPEASFKVYGLTFNLRYAWAIVVIVSAISFVTHLIIKYVKQHALEYAAFFGGLVSSLATLSVFSVKISDSRALVPLLSIVSAGALTGDLVLIAAINTALFEKSTLPLLLVLLSFGVGYKLFSHRLAELHVPPGRHPLSLKFIAEFTIVFLVISAAITSASSNQTNLLAASFFSGMVSSTSAIASVAYLFVQENISANTAAFAFLLAKWASLMTKTTLLAAQHPEQKSIWITLVLAIVFGGVGLWFLR